MRKVPAMLGKRAVPASDARSPELILTTPRDGLRVFEAAVQGPASPLERDPRSPKGWKNRKSAGVGLGIVAALEKSGSGGDVAAKAVMGSPRFGALSPPVASSPRTADRVGGFCWEGCRAGVSSAGAGRKKDPCRGVFCEVDEEDDGWGSVKWEASGCFSSSLPRPRGAAEDFRFSPTADFLSSCNLCKKKLHGEDIYMYRGEKAFCSMECRYRQIVIDEYQENCASEVPKPPSDVPISDYSAGRLFYSGIAAA